MARLRELLNDTWTLVRPYWFSEDRWAGRGLLLLVIGLNLAIVYINVLLNQWNNAFYNALQDKDYAVFWSQLVRFTWLAALFIVAAVYQLYLNQMLQIRWRRWLTDRYLGAWLADGAYYRMQLDRRRDGQPRPAHRRGSAALRGRDAHPRDRWDARGGDARGLHRHPLGALGLADHSARRPAGPSPATWSGPRCSTRSSAPGSRT